jgi:hypothetical protein
MYLFYVYVNYLTILLEHEMRRRMNCAVINEKGWGGSGHDLVRGRVLGISVEDVMRGTQRPSQYGRSPGRHL